MAVVGKLVAAHRHVPLALAQGSAHITCLGCSNVWQCIEALLSSPCLHTLSDIATSLVQPPVLVLSTLVLAKGAGSLLELYV